MTTKPNGLCILYLTPYYYAGRGNAVTAGRMKRFLEKKGHHVYVYAFEEDTAPIDHLLKWADIVHALHIRRAAEFLEGVDLPRCTPLVLTTGGTDINIDLNDQQKKKQMETFLNETEALAVFTEDGKKKVLQNFPWLKDRVQVIPQAVPAAEKKVQHVPFLPEGFPKLLLPSGLRPVKDVLHVQRALDELRNDFPDLQFLLVGEVLDQEVKQEVERTAALYSWFSYHPPVPYEKMGAYYQWADVILNTSISEGQSMSLLEGMAWKTPALARENPGNESVVAPGVNGYLFSSPDEFSTKLKDLLADPEHYQHMAAEALCWVQQRHHPETEAERYIDLYYTLLA